MVAGGTEAACTRFGIAGFCAMKHYQQILIMNQKEHRDHGIRTEMALFYRGSWCARFRGI